MKVVCSFNVCFTVGVEKQWTYLVNKYEGLTEEESNMGILLSSALYRQERSSKHGLSVFGLWLIKR